MEGGAEGLTVVPAVSGGWGGGSLLHPRALYYTAMLMIISLCSPSEKQQQMFIFVLMRSCGHQICQQPVVRVPFLSEMLVVPQPIGIHVLTS